MFEAPSQLKKKVVEVPVAQLPKGKKSRKNAEKKSAAKDSKTDIEDSASPSEYPAPGDTTPFVLPKFSYGRNEFENLEVVSLGGKMD